MKVLASCQVQLPVVGRGSQKKSRPLEVRLSLDGIIQPWMMKAHLHRLSFKNP
jgi:hypothetical protein